MKFSYFEVRPCIAETENDPAGKAHECIRSYADEDEFEDVRAKFAADDANIKTFWTVYGRYPDEAGQHLAMAIGDFATKEAAHDVMAALPTFDSEEVDAALSVWEAMFEMRVKIPELDRAWNNYGTSAMRQEAAKLGKAAQAAWLALSDDDRDGICAPFDWEFVPAFLMQATFHKRGCASIDGTPAEIAQRVVVQLSANLAD